MGSTDWPVAVVIGGFIALMAALIVWGNK